jgi:predicted nucleic acid-binding protein
VIVVDTNLVLGLLLRTDERQVAEAVLDRDGHWLAPRLLRSELRNVVARAVRQSELSATAAETLCARAALFVEFHDELIEDKAVIQRAATSGCTAYDCEFVALAERLGVSLVTSDKQLLVAFPATAIHPREFGSGEFWRDRISEALVGYGLRSGEPLDAAGVPRTQRRGRASPSARRRRAA